MSLRGSFPVGGTVWGGGVALLKKYIIGDRL